MISRTVWVNCPQLTKLCFCFSVLKLDCHCSVGTGIYFRFDIWINYTFVVSIRHRDQVYINYFLQVIPIRICSIPPKWTGRRHVKSYAVVVALIQQRTNRLYLYYPWYGVSAERLQTQIRYIDTPRCRIAYVGCHNFGNSLPTEVSAANEQVLFINVHVIITSAGVMIVILRFFIDIFFFSSFVLYNQSIVYLFTHVFVHIDFALTEKRAVQFNPRRILVWNQLVLRTYIARLHLLLPLFASLLS